MNKTLRLASLAVLALLLTCMCLARPGRSHRMPRTGCVLGCGNYCRAFGMLTYKSCHSCYCYQPTPVLGGGGGGCSGGCTGFTGCTGGCYSGCDGGSGGCGSDGGCGGGGCGGGGCGGC
jgi:hypothetical protein